MKTQMIIVAAPSGAGKSSFVERICREDNRLIDTITFTTRSMREGESQGHPYHFVSVSEFEKKVAEGFFVEWAKVHTNFYGTPFYQLEDTWKKNKCVIMDIDVQGAETFKRKYPELSKSIFIIPPSIDELRRRILKRDAKPPADLEVRMINAEKEMARAKEFDFSLVNDNFEESYLQFKKIIDQLLSKD